MISDLYVWYVYLRKKQCLFLYVWVYMKERERERERVSEWVSMCVCVCVFVCVCKANLFYLMRIQVHTSLLNKMKKLVNKRVKSKKANWKVLERRGNPLFILLYLSHSHFHSPFNIHSLSLSRLSTLLISLFLSPLFQ